MPNTTNDLENKPFTSEEAFEDWFGKWKVENNKRTVPRRWINSEVATIESDLYDAFMNGVVYTVDYVLDSWMDRPEDGVTEGSAEEVQGSLPETVDTTGHSSNIDCEA